MLKIEQLKIDEIKTLYNLILEMASFEHLEKELTLTENKLCKYIFEEKIVKVDLLRLNDKLVGYLMYYYTFSSFTGTPSLYLEDIYIREDYKHQGFGSFCFKYLAKKALDYGCERMDFVCLDWNVNAQNFYKKIGANPHKEWLLERIDKNNLEKMVK